MTIFEKSLILASAPPAEPSLRTKILLDMFDIYEACSNMNASRNGKRFYKGLYVAFKLAPDLKKNTVNVSSYSPLNEGHVNILTNSMLRTYTSGIDERIILR